MSSTNDNNVTFNEISLNNNGIQLVNSNDNLIFNNTVFDNENSGIYLYYNSDSNTILNNSIYNTGGAYDQNYGIYLLEWSGNVPEYNNITGNIVDGNSNYGIYSRDADHNRYWDNILINNEYGMYFHEYSDNNFVYNNTAKNNSEYGIYLYFTCVNNSIYNNTLVDNSNYGLFLLRCGANNVFNNTVMETAMGETQDTGICIQGCYDVNITDNFIFNHTVYGIHILENSNRSLIKSNDIFNNTQIGAFLSDQYGNYSENNIFTLNNFSGNGLHAKDNLETAINYWYDPIANLGNIWANYTGVDANDNGIGDTAHPIPGEAGREDSYPIFSDQQDVFGEDSYIPGPQFYMIVIVSIISAFSIAIYLLKRRNKLKTIF